MKMGIPLAEDLAQGSDMPHTITYALTYRERINGFQQLPKEKRPPRNLWDKPYKLSQFFDEVFERGSGPQNRNYIEYDMEEIE